MTVREDDCLPNCPKCGAEVEEEMSFCPRCGAPVKVAHVPPPPPPAPTERKEEKAEKHEKREKGEKWEKYEKRELLFIGPLIGGIILVILGALTYLEVTDALKPGVTRAVFLIIIGVIVLIGALYVVTTAPRRHPKP
jgi:hypothetical protein